METCVRNTASCLLLALLSLETCRVGHVSWPLAGKRWLPFGSEEQWMWPVWALGAQGDWLMRAQGPGGGSASAWNLSGYCQGAAQVGTLRSLSLGFLVF